MIGNTNYTSQLKETSKLYKALSSIVGISRPRKSHRGIIAKRFLQAYQLQRSIEIEQGLNTNFLHQYQTKGIIKVNSPEGTYYI